MPEYAANQETAGKLFCKVLLTQSGTPYSFGGGGVDGPSRGVNEGANIVGFDCETLSQFGGARVGIVLPDTTEAAFILHQLRKGIKLQPGDQLFIAGSDGSASEPGHVMTYLSAGKVIQAPFTGEDVGVYDYDTSVFNFATRPALALPAKATIKRAGLVAVNVAQQEIATRNGWLIRYWNAHSFPVETSEVSTILQRYAVKGYAKKRSR